MKEIVVKYRKGEKKFEILVYSDKVYEYMEKGGNLEEVLVYPEVYTDVSTGDVASREDLRKVFGTEDVYKVAEVMIREGEVPLTTEQRRKIKEEKKRRIVAEIAKIAFDPVHKTPIPPQRIERAMEEAKVNVDPFKPVEVQVPEIIKAIRKIIPISVEKRKVEAVIPPQYASRAYGIIKPYMKREEWLGDGSLKVMLEVPGGLVDEVLGKLAQVTKGDIRTRVIE